LTVNSTVAGEVTAYLWGGGGGGGGGPDGNQGGGGYGPTLQGSTATDPFHGVFVPSTSGYYIRNVGQPGESNFITGYSVVVDGAEVYRNNSALGQPAALRPPPDLAFRRDYVGLSYNQNFFIDGILYYESVECYNFSYSAVSPGAAGNGQAGSYSRITFNVEPGDLIEVGVGQGGGAGRIRTSPTSADSGGPYYQGSTANNPFGIGVISPGTSGYYVLGQGRASGNDNVSFTPTNWIVVVDGVIVYGDVNTAPPESFAKPTAFVGYSYYVEAGNPYYSEYDAVQCYTFQYTASGPGGVITAGGQPGLGYSPKEIFSSRTPGPGDAVVPVKNVAYNDFMNAYGVWDPDTGLTNFTRTYQVYFPISAIYVFTMGCDTYGRVYLDDVLFMEGQGYSNTGTPVSYVLNVQQGFHTVKMQGQGASLLPVWTTRSPGATGTPVFPGADWGPGAGTDFTFLTTYGISSVPVDPAPTGRALAARVNNTWNSVTFPVSGYYTIQMNAWNAQNFGLFRVGDGVENPGQLSIDGTIVMTLPRNYAVAWLIQTQTVYITAGTHDIGLLYQVRNNSSAYQPPAIAVSIQLDAGVPGVNSMALAITSTGSLNAYSGGVGGSSGQQGISGSGGGGGGATTLFKNGQLIAVAAGGGGGGGAGRLNRIIQCDAPGLGGFNTAYDGVPTGTAGQDFIGDGGGGGGAGGGVVGGLGGGTRGNETTGFGGANGSSQGDYTQAASNLDTPGQESPYWDRRRGNGGLGGSVFTAVAQPGGGGYAVVVFKQSGVQVKDAGVWKSPRVVWIKQNNVWTQVDTVWVKDGTGQWNKVLGSNSSAPDFEPVANQMGWTYYPYPLGDEPAPPPPPDDPPTGYWDTGPYYGVF
jgi:hypothetical protein